MNILHHIDCMKYMKDIPDNHFDLGIVDVNYGIGEDGKSNNSRGSSAGANKWKGSRNTTGAGIPSTQFKIKEWDKTSPEIEYFQELKRITRSQIIWGANHFISKIPFDSSCWIVWDKKNGNSDFADCELAYTSFKTAVRIFSYRWNGMLQGDMKNKEIRIHPTQKPIALYKWLLTNYAKPGDKLFDSHSGSGSFRIAAYDMGFDLISCELDADYCRDNEARFQKHIQQIDLFSSEEIQEKIYTQPLL